MVQPLHACRTRLPGAAVSTTSAGVEPLPNKEVLACAAYENGRKTGDVEIEDISDVLLLDGPFVWIGLFEPSAPLMLKIREEFDLHELAVEDALRAHQRPKLEEYGNSLFVVLRTVESHEGQLALGETHVFVGPRYVVSVRHGASKPYGSVRSRCESTPQHLAKGPGFVLYAIMDYVVDQFFPAVEEIEEALGCIEEAVFTGSGTDSRETMAAIYERKRDLAAIKHAVSPLVDVCNRLVRFDAALIPEDTRPYFRDVYDHVIRVNERLDHLREMLNTLLEANLALVSVHQNDVTKRLAAWAAIIAVPTMIAGIYGMNFRFMPELDARYGYPAAMAGMATLCAFLYWRLRKAGWL